MVRVARPGDEAEILRMIRALAAYEREPDAVKATEASLQAAMFGPDAGVHAFIAELDGRSVGLALWFRNFSTWTGTQGLYLEDLFVDEAARGRGVGRALFRALAGEAARRGYQRIDWAVLDWNIEAMDFYTRIGARATRGWQPWRLDAAGIARLAAEG
ncbi:GNAT family N-acetyltransferase [Sphingomonas quercus]|uniref:GNAT family N-acetyltransferase n=1 Tax=Sphingomonas quercus TaxID=2842451 RepID=A0ABS6BG97_9SPHN|nr:GNAT family N-acetyltransferase [Sphingomonas quercus]MBU3076856.1 GNAT family N-acetyltransferase [Sphingomonas quercus]